MRIDWRAVCVVAGALALAGPAVAGAQHFFGRPELGPGPGMGRPSRNLAAKTGISVKLMTMDTKTAMANDQLSAAKNCP